LHIQTSLTSPNSLQLAQFTSTAAACPVLIASPQDKKACKTFIALNEQLDLPHPIYPTLCSHHTMTLLYYLVSMEVQVPAKLWDKAMRMTCNNNNYHLTFFLMLSFPLLLRSSFSFCSSIFFLSFSSKARKFSKLVSTRADDFGCIPGGFN